MGMLIVCMLGADAMHPGNAASLHQAREMWLAISRLCCRACARSQLYSFRICLFSTVFVSYVPVHFIL
jgi:hypothetical protein